MNQKKNQKNMGHTNVKTLVEDVLKCKWTLTVLDLVNQGVNRPGAMVRQTPGLTTKVLNERLRKLQGYGILNKQVYPETPLRVEYNLTDFGEKFGRILDAIAQLQTELDT